MLFLDINDLFREMMNRGRREWTDGRGDNGEDWDDGERRPPNIRLPKVKKIWFALGGLFVLFTMILPWFANFMTDLYWFEANGYDAVFFRALRSTRSTGASRGSAAPRFSAARRRIRSSVKWGSWSSSSLSSSPS